MNQELEMTLSGKRLKLVSKTPGDYNHCSWAWRCTAESLAKLPDGL